MTVEASLLGVPSISCFPGPKPLYLQYLERLGVIETIRSPRVIASKIQQILDRPELFNDRKKMGKKLLTGMEDPIAKILSTVRLAGQRDRD
jgi:predicted glycosyltransferase